MIGMGEINCGISHSIDFKDVRRRACLGQLTTPTKPQAAGLVQSVYQPGHKPAAALRAFSGQSNTVGYNNQPAQSRSSVAVTPAGDLGQIYNVDSSNAAA